MILRPLAGALLALACGGSPGAPPLVAVSDGRSAMGTVLEITLYAPSEEAGRARLEPLFQRVAELEALFSRHDPGSALRGLNARAGQGPQPVPAELARILEEAQRYAQQTRGGFDVTVGPLVELWGEAARRGRPPSAAERRAARARVGSERLRVGAGEPARAELLDAGMAVDLDGLAKGYALDRLRERLAADGVTRAFASFGRSSLLAVGAPPGEPGWRVLLADPAGGAAGVVLLRDASLSVSASLGQTREIGGRRFGHVIDPRSGRALRRALQAVVVAPSGALAEAWSKALLVLEGEEALALLAARPGAEGLLLGADGARRATPGFARAVAFEPLGPGS